MSQDCLLSAGNKGTQHSTIEQKDKHRLVYKVYEERNIKEEDQSEISAATDNNRRYFNSNIKRGEKKEQDVYRSDQDRSRSLISPHEHAQIPSVLKVGLPPRSRAQGAKVLFHSKGDIHTTSERGELVSRHA
jgi:hypothetical protein